MTQRRNSGIVPTHPQRRNRQQQALYRRRDDVRKYLEFENPEDPAEELKIQQKLKRANTEVKNLERKLGI